MSVGSRSGDRMGAEGWRELRQSPATDFTLAGLGTVLAFSLPRMRPSFEPETSANGDIR